MEKKGLKEAICPSARKRPLLKPWKEEEQILERKGGMKENLHTGMKVGGQKSIRDLTL